ncbi:MAG: anti-sigma factor [Sporichthyaceae bacterium]
MSERSELHMLTGVYASGALAGAERTSFETHLERCAHCRQEVRELTETAALLGIAASETPPPALRANVMAEIASTRQLPPVLASLAEHVESRRGSTRVRRASLSVAACLAVFSIGLGAYATALHQENSDLRRESAQIAALATADDSQTLTTAGGGAVASLTMSRQDGGMVFVSRGLGDLPDERTYQLWLINAKGATSVGTFTPSNGRHAPRLISGPGKATSFAVTIERQGGAVQPTTAPVLSFPIPATAA